jgi:hypothetical protein
MTGTLSSYTMYCVSYLINATGEFSLTYGWERRDPLRAYRWDGGAEKLVANTFRNHNHKRFIGHASARATPLILSDQLLHQFRFVSS